MSPAVSKPLLTTLLLFTAACGGAGSEDAGLDSGPSLDFGTIPDLGPEDTGPRDSGTTPPDTGSPEIGPRDLGGDDVGSEDSGTPEVGPRDIGPEDSGMPEVGPWDIGPEDAGTPEVGPGDGSIGDLGPADAGPPEVGTMDAGGYDGGQTDGGGPDGGMPDGGTVDGGLPPLSCACPAPSVNATQYSECIIPTPQNQCAGYCRGVQNARLECMGRGCDFECHEGWGDCDGDLANGCETRLDTTSDCASCGNQCAAGEACSATGCVASCVPPETSCGGDVCASLASDALHCGGCDQPCRPQHRAYEVECTNGQCQSGCPSGSVLCHGACVDTSLLVNGTCPSCTARAPSGALSLCDPIQGRIFQCPADTEVCSGECVDLAFDPDHCGACGAACAGDCVLGQCQAAGSSRLASISASSVRSLAQDATHLYWIEDDRIVRVAKAGGSPQVLASQQLGPEALAVSGGYVFWSNRLGASIARIAAHGSGGVQTVTAANAPTYLVADSTHIFWWDSGTNRIRRVPQRGSNASTFATPREPISGLAVDATDVYWTDSWGVGAVDDYVWKAPKAGGAAVSTGLPANVAFLFVDDHTIANANLTLTGNGTLWIRNKATLGYLGEIPIGTSIGGPTPLILRPDHISSNTYEYFVSDGTKVARFSRCQLAPTLVPVPFRVRGVVATDRDLFTLHTTEVRRTALR